MHLVQMVQKQGAICEEVITEVAMRTTTSELLQLWVSATDRSEEVAPPHELSDLRWGRLEVMVALDSPVGEDHENGKKNGRTKDSYYLEKDGHE